MRCKLWKQTLVRSEDSATFCLALNSKAKQNETAPDQNLQDGEESFKIDSFLFGTFKTYYYLYSIKLKQMENTLVGKYILEDWECNGHKSRHLRWINRETKKYYCSDVQRYVRNWRAKGETKYEFFKEWATNFVKDNSILGFRRSITRLSNTDGVMKLSVFNSPAECKCEYTFDEVFGNDLRDIQDPADNPLRSKLFMIERHPETESSEDFKQFLIKEEPDATGFSAYNNEFIKKLQRLFNVSEVYSTSFEKITEHKKQTILTKSATLFQIIDSNYDKKQLTLDENSDNMTILFWLFDDKLVYQREEGKDTW